MLTSNNSQFQPIESTDYPGFFICAKYPNIAVSAEGEAVNLTGKFAGRKTMGSTDGLGSPIVWTTSAIMPNGGNIPIHRLMGEAILGPPAGLTGLNSRLIHLDGDRTNNDIENIVWNVIPDLGTLTPLIDFDYQGPIESTQYPGYYTSPMFPDIAINRQGETIRLRSYHPQMIGKHSYGGKDRKGYHSIHTVNLEKGKVASSRVHRIAAYVFIGPPTTNAKGELQTQVNHMDGNKSNNTPGNLEWCTNTENMEHAILIGLQADKLRPVTVMDLKTNLVTDYPSIAEARRVIGCSSLGNHLQKDEMIPHNRQYLVKYREDNRDWPTEFTYGVSHLTTEIRVKDYTTGKVNTYESISEAGRDIGIDPSHMARALREGNDVFFKERYVARYTSDDRDWPAGFVKGANHTQGTKTALSVRDTGDGRVVEFRSIKKAAAYTGVNASTLERWLKRNTAVGELFQNRWEITRRAIEGAYKGPDLLPIAVLDTATGEVTTYTAMYLAAKACQISEVKMRADITKQRIRLHKYRYYAKSMSNMVDWPTSV